MTKLLINIDHVATLRNARQESFPDPVEAAEACERAGADGIVFHLRADRRHIVDQDVPRLKERVKGKLDFELSLDPEIVAICSTIRPDLATFVPETREEITTEGGLDVMGSRDRLAEVLPEMKAQGIQTALFVDPVIEQIEMTAELGADAIELHTGEFANARSESEARSELDRLAESAERATALGLLVHAGHGLDRFNYSSFASAVKPLSEVSIGFAVVARSVMVGMEAAVSEMLTLVREHA